ncbi:MAG: haloacid dehalogenase domain protein hydrolase [Herbaspirillum sp.]|nr:haloacid dehalogenase domain protein hydrolase [Herbaspirillum sp.]
MSVKGKVVFLFDCDNTLLDNDRVQSDLRAHIEAGFGAAERDRYWRVFEQLREQLGYVDYLGAMQCFRSGAANHPALLQLSAFLLDYPFAERLYPGALSAVHRLGEWGETVILSDGDIVLQPRKIQRSGLWQAVEGRVLIYVHKEKMLEQMQQCYPADHYVMVDDKLAILTAMKQHFGARLTTVLPLQGHYALDPGNRTLYPAADISIERIGDLNKIDLLLLLNAAIATQ